MHTNFTGYKLIKLFCIFLSFLCLKYYFINLQTSVFALYIYLGFKYNSKDKHNYCD